MTDSRFAFERQQHDHDAKTFGFATEGPSLTRQEFAEECDINVLMAYGRCLRPALYSSLRSSPSHPTGVSALRVTIAIANARFARKQWGLRKSTAKSRRLFRNESATRRRVRAGAIGGSTAMGRTVCCRKSPRYRESLGLEVGPWEPALEAGREGKIKALAPNAGQAVVCTSKI